MPDATPKNEAVGDTSSSRGSSKKFPIKKILLAIVLAFVTVGIFFIAVALIFPQIPAIITLKMKFPQSKYEYIYDAPVAREVSQNTGIKGGAEFVLDGVRFTSPWSSKPEKMEKEGMDALTYRKENKIIFLPKNEDEVFNNLLPYDNRDEYEKIKLLYGEDVLESKYLFYKAILEANPKELNIFTPKREGIAKSLLVIYKVGLQIPLEGGIYSFETDVIKGFQFGDPKVSRGVEIRFFDSEDTVYAVVLQGATQKEIDFLLSSIKSQ